MEGAGGRGTGTASQLEVSAGCALGAAVSVMY